MEKYIYYVTYHFGNGMGCCFIARDNPIECAQDIQGIARYIKGDFNYQSVLICNFILIKKCTDDNWQQWVQIPVEQKQHIAAPASTDETTSEVNKKKHNTDWFNVIGIVLFLLILALAVGLAIS